MAVYYALFKTLTYFGCTNYDLFGLAENRGRELRSAVLSTEYTRSVPFRSVPFRYRPKQDTAYLAVRVELTVRSSLCL